MAPQRVSSKFIDWAPIQRKRALKGGKRGERIFLKNQIKEQQTSKKAPNASSIITD